MKAIIVHQALADLGGGYDIPVTRICADSAIARDTMPLFVPDIPLGWYARVCPAFRISRLGKHISGRFALRYADAVTAVCLLCASDDTYIASGLAAIIDNAVTTGHFLPWTPDIRDIDIAVNDASLHVNTADIRLAAVISEVSLATTLKSGDLIIFDTPAIDLPLVPGSRIIAGIAGSQCLNLKVK